MLNGKFLKCRIIHICTVVCLIGNCTDNQKRYPVKGCCLSNCRTLHLNCICTKFFYNGILHALITYKLVSGSNSSLKNLNFRIYFLTYIVSNFTQALICLGRKIPSSAESVPSDIQILLHPYHDEEHLWKVRYLRC